MMQEIRLDSLFRLASRYKKRSSGLPLEFNKGRKASPAMEQVEKAIAKTQRQENGCINWTGAKDFRGYGFVTFQLRLIRAPRFFYVAFVADDDPEKEILHSCDNPSCVNTDHLRQGTHRENMEEMVSRNRRNHAKGERVNTAKLYAERVIELRRLFGAGESINSISAKTGLRYGLIWSVVNWKTWKHL